jgi:hypothetical protein
MMGQTGFSMLRAKGDPLGDDQEDRAVRAEIEETNAHERKH